MPEVDGRIDDSDDDSATGRILMRLESANFVQGVLLVSYARRSGCGFLSLVEIARLNGLNTRIQRQQVDIVALGPGGAAVAFFCRRPLGRLNTRRLADAPVG